MKRAFLLKGLVAILCFWVWQALAGTAAALAATGIVASGILFIFIPIFDPRSNAYVTTISSVAGERDALTFDDGPDPVFTPLILDILRREGVRAAFFVVGTRAEQYPDLVRAILAEGHIIANHTLRHQTHFHFGGRRAFTEDMAAFDHITERLFGLRCAFFRAPLGFRSPLLADAIRARGLQCIGWRSRGLDSIRSDPSRILKKLLRGLRPGSILLLHDGAGLGGGPDRSATVAVLPELLREIQRRGLRCERLDIALGKQAYEACVANFSPVASLQRLKAGHRGRRANRFFSHTHPYSRVRRDGGSSLDQKANSSPGRRHPFVGRDLRKDSVLW
jgi:peptidoglycan/xylan/chitin deacetylase (PgdA/CDA1 family)